MSNKTNSGRIHCTLVLAVAVSLLATSASALAAPLPVYGGPTYDSSTSTGYVAQFIAPTNHTLGVNDAGTAVGYAIKYDAEQPTTSQSAPKNYGRPTEEPQL